MSENERFFQAQHRLYGTMLCFSFEIPDNVDKIFVTKLFIMTKLQGVFFKLLTFPLFCGMICETE